MRAFVLAAGLGTRLRPLTRRIPKCLIPIGGRPLLTYWLDLFQIHGVKRILMNTHYLHEQVVEFINSIELPILIELVYEPTLLGSGGTLQANRSFVEDVKEFFIVYADTLTNVNLTILLKAHRQMEQVATLGLFRTPSPTECGIVLLDKKGIVVDFQEKPAQPLSDLAFAGVMVASPKIFDFISDQVPCDLSKDVLRCMVGSIAGLELNAYVCDIGTFQRYERAQADMYLLKSKKGI